MCQRSNDVEHIYQRYRFLHRDCRKIGECVLEMDYKKNPKKYYNTYLTSVVSCRFFDCTAGNYSSTYAVVYELLKSEKYIPHLPHILHELNLYIYDML